MSLPASNGKTVLITGINGYIASVLGMHLLEKGYSLRGTARRAHTSEALLHGPYAAYKDRIHLVEVPDMTVDGAFDEAVKGVDGIFHTASPIDFSLNTYEQMVVPAFKGNETILASALKAGPQLKMVVITSSTIAIIDPGKPPGSTFTESDFASAALEKVLSEKGEGVQFPPGLLYAASKTASERAIWSFRETHKPSFAISTINPSVVWGPPVLLPKDPAKLNETLRPIYTLLSPKTTEVPADIGSSNFVDVRDVALLHIWAYEHPSEADGERYIAAAGFGPIQGAADILRQEYKGTKYEKGISVGNPGNGYIGYDKETGKVGKVEFLPEGAKMSGKKAERVTGIKWRSFNQSVIETAKALEPLL